MFFKIPRAPHPVPQLTTSELDGYVSALKAVLELDPPDDPRQIILGRLREAYMEINQRAGIAARAENRAREVSLSDDTVTKMAGK